MKGGFLYQIIRPFAKIVIGAYFRKLHISHIDHIPASGPLIIACNHPNSFVEACILATYQPRTLHFLVRGDVFKQPPFAWFLKQTNQIPIYRFRDGYSGIKKNELTFSACYEKLAKGAAIVIFSEASSIFEKRLRPIQKGTARLAFGTWEKQQMLEELHILPVGINYSHGDQFRSEVMLNIGNPIKLSSYIDSYKANPQQAVNEVTSELESTLKSLVFHIDKPNDQLFDDLADLMDAASPTTALPIIKNDRVRFIRENTLCEKLNKMSSGELKEISDKVAELKKMLYPGINHLTDLRYVNNTNGLSGFHMILAMIFAIPGISMHLVPFYLSKLIALPFLNHIEFYTGVRMGSLLILSAFQQIILGIFSLFYQNWILFFLVLSSPLTGAYAVLFIEEYKSMIKSSRLSRKSNINNIKTQFQDILSIIKASE